MIRVRGEMMIKSSSDGDRPDNAREDKQFPRPGFVRKIKARTGPPDPLLWRDLICKLGGLFGGVVQMAQPRGPRRRKTKAMAAVSTRHEECRHWRWFNSCCDRIDLARHWLLHCSRRGQQAVITQFGKYNPTVGAGFNWRLPYRHSATKSWW